MRSLVVTLMAISTIASAQARVVWERGKGAADVYPTEQSAIQAIAAEILSDLTSQRGFEQSGWQIVVIELSQKDSGLPPLPGGNVGVAGSWGSTTSSGQISDEITKAASKHAISTALTELQRALPRARVRIGNRSDPMGEHQATLEIGVGEVQHLDQRSPVICSGYTGRVKANLRLLDSDRSIDAQFGIQRWVEDPTGFMNQQPQKTWIIGRSNHLFDVKSDALASACEDAANQFANQMSGRVQIYDAGVPREALQAAALEHFSAGETTDRFVQRIASPGGEKWRAAVLVSSDPSVVQQIMPAAHVEMRVQKLDVPSPWIKSVVVMVLVVIGLYIFLKGATRGFFSRPKMQ